MEIFQVDAVAISWILTIYMVATGMVMPLTGFLGEKYGKKKVYMTGLLVFIVGSLIGTFSSSLWMIILARAIQGAGGGLIMPTAMALIFNAFPKHERGLAVGIYGIALMVAPAIGPTVGGMLITFFDWPYLFITNLPFTIMGFLFSIKYLKETEKNPTLKFDVIGFILITLGIGSILYALGNSPTLALLLSPINVTLLIGGFVLIVAFIKYESTQEQPLLDLSIFKIPTYAISIAATSCASIGLFSGIFLLPLLLQQVYGIGEVQTGLLFLPAALMSGIFMSIGGRILDVKGPKYVVPLGLFIMGSLTVLLGFNTLATSFWTILMINVLRSAGLGMANMPASTAGLNAVKDHQVGQGSAINNILRQMTASFTIVFFSIYYEVRRGTLFAHNIEFRQASLQAINEAFIIAGVIILLVMPFAFFLKGPQDLQKSKPKKKLLNFR